MKKNLVLSLLIVTSMNTCVINFAEPKTQSLTKEKTKDMLLAATYLTAGFAYCAYSIDFISWLCYQDHLRTPVQRFYDKCNTKINPLMGIAATGFVAFHTIKAGILHLKKAQSAK